MVNIMIESGFKEQVYKKNFITNVIFKINFSKILDLSEKKPPIKLKKIINEKFPGLEVKRIPQINTRIMKDSTLDVKGTTKVLWIFSNREKTIKVEIDQEYLAIEYNKYNNFTEFFQTIKYIFKEFIELYDIKIINSLGLRYINQIKLNTGNPLDWDNLINQNLFCISKNFVKENYRNNISRSMHLLDINEKEYKLRFQFGMHNSEYPNPINRKEFILDYDCTSKEEMEIGEAPNKVKMFNTIVYDWFESSIMDGLRKEMGVIKHEK